MLKTGNKLGCGAVELDSMKKGLAVGSNTATLLFDKG